MKKFGYFLATLVAIALLLFLTRKHLYELYVIEHFDKFVPAFELQTFDGEIISSGDLKGKVVVLDFWATWCGPCRKTFPLLEKVYQDYRNHPKVVFYVVNTSWNQDTMEKARDFIEKNGYNLPFVYDEGAKLSDAIVRPRGIPTFCILDKSGRLRIRHVGYLEFWENYPETLAKYIDKQLEEK